MSQCTGKKKEEGFTDVVIENYDKRLWLCYVNDSEGLRPYVCPLTLPLSRLGLPTHSEATVVLEVSDGETFCKHICFL